MDKNRAVNCNCRIMYDHIRGRRSCGTSLDLRDSGNSGSRLVLPIAVQYAVFRPTYKSGHFNLQFY